MNGAAGGLATSRTPSAWPAASTKETVKVSIRLTVDQRDKFARMEVQKVLDAYDSYNFGERL